MGLSVFPWIGVWAGLRRRWLLIGVVLMLTGAGLIALSWDGFPTEVPAALALCLALVSLWFHRHGRS
jgi:hypothetical protein